MNEKNLNEFEAKKRNGMAMLLLSLGLEILFIGFIIVLFAKFTDYAFFAPAFILSLILVVVVIPIFMMGLKVVKPGEALVLTFFGEYIGSICKEGFYHVNPFATATVPDIKGGAKDTVITGQTATGAATTIQVPKKRISTKVITLNNQTQKINDLMGNPIDIGIVVFWKVSNTYMAVFSVDDYYEFLSTQCDSALRNIVRSYPYDSKDDEIESLRGSSQGISDLLKKEIQEKVEVAGLEILEARITHLAYAQEIAAAMLQRQQASAVVDARQLIVDGAVGMVEMALNKLSENEVVELDEERKAQMVSNLLVVLCSNKDTQPIVNSGSIY